MSPRIAVLGVSTSIYSTGMAMDYLKNIGSQFLIWAMLTSCSKHGRIKELHFSVVQDAREMFLESITIGFEPEHFGILLKDTMAGFF